MNATGIVVLVVALLAALGFGFYRRATDGRVSRVGKPVDNTHLLARLGFEPSHQATVVQFSSEFCAPCRTTRTLLTQLVTEHQIGYVELDAAENLDLVEEYGVTRTPTILVLDASGTVRHKAVGVPTKTEILHAVQLLADDASAA